MDGRYVSGGKAPLGTLAPNGRVDNGETFQRNARRRGMCDVCGRVQTHDVDRRSRLTRQIRCTPLTLETDGKQTVYRGLCLSPTCYTMKEAKRILFGQSSTSWQSDLTTSRHSHSRTGSQDFSRESFQFRNAVATRTGTTSTITTATPLDSALPLAISISIGIEEASTEPAYHGLARFDSNVATASATQDNSSCSPNSHNSPLPDLSSPTSSGEEESSNHSPQLGDSEHHYQQQQHRQPIRSAPDHQLVIARFEPDSPHAMVLRGLEELAEVFDFTRFLATMASHLGKPPVVLGALSLLCRYFSKVPDEWSGRHVFVSDAWVKNLKDVQESSPSDRLIQERLVFTLWVIGSVSALYVTDMRRRGGIEVVLEAWRSFPVPDFSVVCFSALACFTEVGSGVKLRSEPGDAILRVCIEFLLQPVPSTTEAHDEETLRTARGLALRCLYNLSLQGSTTRTGQSFFEAIQNGITSRNGFNIILSYALEDSKQNALLVDSVMGLTWRLSYGDETWVPSATLTKATFHTLVNTKHEPSRIAAIGIVANIVTKLETNFHERGARTLVEELLVCLRQAPQLKEREALHLGTLHTLNNMIGKQLFIDGPHPPGWMGNVETVVHGVVECMWMHLGVQNVLAMGTITLTYIGALEPNNQVVVATKGGFRILTAIINRYFPTGPSPTRTFLQEYVCLAITRLATVDTVFSLVRNDPTIKAFIVESQASDMHPSIKRSVIGLAAALDEVVLKWTPPQLANALASARREDEATELLSNLYDMLSGSPEELGKLLVAQNHWGNGISQIVSFMTQFSTSVELVAWSCAILGLTYCYYPFTGLFKSVYQAEYESRVYTFELHTVAEIEAIRKCLLKQYTEPLIAEHATKALLSFLSPIATPTGKLQTVQVRNVLKRSLTNVSKAIVNMMSVYTADPILQKNCILLFRCVLFLDDEEELKRWCPMMIEKLTRALVVYRTEATIASSACQCLSAIAETMDERSISALSRHTCVVALLDLLLQHSEVVVASATECLEVMQRRLVAASVTIAGIFGAGQRIVNCMVRFKDSGTIVANCAAIVVSMASVDESYCRFGVTQGGGTEALLDALSRFHNDHFVVAKVCMALNALSASIVTEDFTRWKDVFVITFSRLLHDNADNPVILSEGFSFLCSLLVTETNYFRERFTEDVNITALIVQAIITVSKIKILCCCGARYPFCLATCSNKASASFLCFFVLNHSIWTMVRWLQMLVLCCGFIPATRTIAE